MSHHLHGAVKTGFDRLECRRLFQTVHDVGRRAFAEAFQNFPKQSLLVAEGPIKTRRIDAHGGRQIGQRRAFVALLPEDIHRAIECFSLVKFFRAATRTSQPLLFVLARYHFS